MNSLAFRSLIAFVFMIITLTSSAHGKNTDRLPQFSNNDVEVWETVIYPSKTQILKMHRHDRNRIVVAFDNGILKIDTSHGKTHLWKLEKNHAYYLSKDIAGEFHTDENITHHPIKVLVIELKN